MSMNESFTIGTLAKIAKVNVETIRFYEKKGLLKRPTSKKGSFRVYSKDYVVKMNFIKQAQALGFTLKEIKEFLFLDESKTATCHTVSERANEKLLEVREKIKALRKMEKSLLKIVASCDLGPDAKACCKVSDCFGSKCS